MAVAVASALVKVVLEKLGQAAVKQLAQIWGVKDDVNSLGSTLSMVKEVLEDAEEKAITDKPLGNWLRKLKDVAYDADDLLEEFQMEAAGVSGHFRGQVAHFFSLSNPCIFRVRMTCKVKKIRARLDEIAAERNQFHLETRPPHEYMQTAIRQRETWSGMDEHSIIGRDGDKESIISNVLMDSTETQENFSVIAIVGIGGLGKTTLAQLVYNDERVAEKKHYFDLPPIWVYVSMEFDPKRVAKAILESITKEEFKVGNLNDIGNELREKLKGKRFFLVLDDVWNENQNQWEILKPIFSVGTKGSKILVTTRSETVARIMSSKTIHHLEGLSEEDCWALFKRRAFEGWNEKDKDPKLVTIGKGIVCKCGGVPLAVKALGSLMNLKKGEQAWLAVRDSKMWELKEVNDQVLPSLVLSYMSLPSQLKQCFLYCSIFPKGYEIDKDHLIAQWNAQGFILSADIGNEYFNNLLWVSFFQDLEETADGRLGCKMHDLVHDLAQFVAGGETLILEPEKVTTTSINKHCRFLAVVGYDIPLELKKNLKKMRAVIVYGTRSVKLDHTMFFNAQCLRALDLREVWVESCVFLSKMIHLRYLHLSCKKILPKSFYGPRNLQTLSLWDCDGLKEIPKSISSLHDLRTLDVVKCSLQTVPEFVGKLHNLQRINLSKCNDLKKLPDSIGDLSNLQELSLSRCKELGQLPDSIGGLSNLRELNLSECDKLGQLPESIDSFSNLQELHLSGCRALDRLPESISGLSNLQELHLSKCWELGRLPESIGLLSELQELDLHGCSKLDRLPENIGNLVRLKKLQLGGCKSLSGMPVGVGKLTNLQALGLFVVGDSEKHAKVSELEELKLIGGDLRICGLRNVRDPEDARRAKLWEKRNLTSSLSLEWQMPADHPNRVVVEREGGEEAVLEGLQPPPNIRELEISCYPGVRFPKWMEEPSPFPKLERITPENVRNSLGGELYGVSHHSDNRIIPFPSLISLEFYNMPNLEEWCTAVECDGSSSSNGQAFPCLYLLRIEGCPKLDVRPGFPPSLEHLWVVSSNEELLSEQSFQQNASHLRELSVVNCKASSTGWKGLQHLTALRFLSISYCIELSSLPEAIRYLTSLQFLEIQECPDLSALPEWLGDLTSLSHLSINHCPSLTCLPQRLQHLTALQHLGIAGCPILARRCKRDQGEDWHIIAHIPSITIDWQRI